MASVAMARAAAQGFFLHPSRDRGEGE